MSDKERLKGRFRKDFKYKAIIEKVISGDRAIVHLYFDDGSDLENIMMLIAGIKAPRTADTKNGTAAEPFGEEAKQYISKRLLNQKVFVSFIGVNANDVLVGKVYHPAGNISEKILLDGLAEVADWQSSLIGPDGMVLLRNAEKSAKSVGKGIWKASFKPVTVAKSSSTFKVGSLIDATIVRMVSPDTFYVELLDGSVKMVYLTSIRSPRASDPTAAFLPQAKEFARKYVGKKVKVLTDAFRNEHPLVSITLPNGKNLAETIVLNGYATVIKHRRGDEDRALNWDSLIEAESVAVKEKKGIHSTKVPKPENYIEASQDAARAKIHLRTLQNKLKIQGYVDFIISPTRYRIVLPKEGIKLVLVLGGLLSVQKESPIASTVVDYVSKKILQRDVTIEVFDVDKVGGFIGNLFFANNQPFQIELLKHGYAEIHNGSVAKTKFENAFYDAEEDAQDKRLGIWVNWDPEEEERKFQEEEAKRQLKFEQKMAKSKKPNPFDDDDEEEDLSNLPEAVRKLVIKR